MQKRRWYGDKINPGTARRYKKILTENGPISDEKVKEILNILGFSPKQPEIW